MRVVITGANRGLGLALSQVYRGLGADVIAGCRTPSSAADLVATGAEVHAFDQGSEGSIDAFVAAIGGRSVDVLINNAGIDATAVGVPSAERSVMELSGEAFLEVMRVNVVGPMLLTRALITNLAATCGRVVNISSQVGSMEVAQRIGRDVSYNSSKAALNMVTIKLAQAFKPVGVAVVAMHPGYLRTDMGGPSADLDPADAAARIADTIATLTLDNSATFIRWDGTVHPW